MRSKKRIIFCLLFTFVCSRAQADITTGLTGWWKYNDGSGSTAVDSSGNGYNASLTNSPSWGGGKIWPFAISWVGSNTTYGTLAQNTFSLFPGGGPGTIAAWVFPISSGGGLCANLGASAVITDAQGAGYFVLGYDGTFICGGVYDGANKFVEYAVTANQWVHAALTWDGVTLTLYINGISQATAAAGTISDGLFQVNFGRGYSGGYLTANVDDLRTYSRALSASDITQLYNYSGSYVNKVNIQNSRINHAKIGY